MNKEDYQKYVEDKSPKSPIFMNCIKAFLVGGLICALGQLIFYFAKSRGLEEKLCYTVVSITLVFLSSFLTALNVFNRIGKFAGARKSYSNYRICKFYCFSSYGIQIRRLCNGCWCKNVYSSRTCSCIRNFNKYYCWFTLYVT